MIAALLALAVLTLIKATPLIYAALGGVLAERSGVVNIGLEGILVAGAFTSVALTAATGNPLLGTLAGVLAGALLAAVLAFAATRLGVDQIVAGTGLNIVSLGAAAYGLIVVFNQPGASPGVVNLGARGSSTLIALAFILAGAFGCFCIARRGGCGCAHAAKIRTPPPPPESIRVARASGPWLRAARSPRSAVCTWRLRN
jgi:ABC-type uncharacterized transport system permease subunit